MKTMLKAESGELLPPRQPPPRNQPQPLPTSSLQTCRMNIDIGPKIMAQQSWNVWNDRAWPRSITTHPWSRIGCIWNRSQNEIPTTSSSSDISSRQEQPNYDRTHNRRSTWILLTSQQCKPIPPRKDFKRNLSLKLELEIEIDQLFVLLSISVLPVGVHIPPPVSTTTRTTFMVS